MSLAEDIGFEVTSPLVSERRVTLPANATDCCFSHDSELCAVALGDGSVALVAATGETQDSPRIVALHEVAAVGGPDFRRRLRLGGAGRARHAFPRHGGR
ncbi:MAG: hypothetical protein HC850_07930 [Rhodomicrobium sp.]|nr:hypothetical protein [Rhodomicrobium sp.]